MKILYVSTVSGTINAFLIPHIKMLVEQGHTVDIACNITVPINEDLVDLGCKIFPIEFQRSPLTKQNYYAYKKLKRIITDKNYDIVHTHTPVASTCVRLACRKMENVKVIYTAHGFHFFKGAPLKNWLLYYPIERFLARYTDVLITINKEDYERAKKSLKARRIKYIHGVGFDTDKFSEVLIDKKLKREELEIPNEAFIITSVGELNYNKNHEIIIKALAMINNSNVYYIICGQGPLDKYLGNISQKLGLEKHVKILGLRKDVPEILNISDIMAFPSFREGLSVALMESMASGLPVVCSNIRGNTDLIKEAKGGYLVNPKNVNDWERVINKLINDAELCESMGVYNREAVKENDITNVIKEILRVYKDVV